MSSSSGGQAGETTGSVGEEISKALDSLPQNWKLFIGCLLLSIATILPRTMPGFLLGLTLSYIIALAVIAIPQLLKEVGEHVTNPFTIATVIKEFMGKITRALIKVILNTVEHSKSLNEVLLKPLKQLSQSIKKKLSLSELLLKLTIGDKNSWSKFRGVLRNWKTVFTLALIVLVGGIIYYADENNYLGWIWSPLYGWVHFEWLEDMIVSATIWALKQIAKLVIYNKLIMTFVGILRSTAGLELSVISAVFTIGFSIIMGIVTIMIIKTIDYIIDHTSSEGNMSINIGDLGDYLKKQITNPKLIIDIILYSLVGI